MRYFFHFIGGESRLDDEIGAPLAGPATARADAVRAAREMIADLLRRNEPLPPDGAIEITDEAGRLVACVPLTEAAFGAMPENRYRRIFDNAARSCLLLTPDFTIIEANRAYLRATMTHLAAIARRPLFDVFPDNPGDPDATGVRNLTASLNAALRGKAEDAMPVQRYDIRRPDGAWEMRYWKPTNVPILDDQGDVEYIVHQVEDVTAAMRGEGGRAG